MLLDFKYLAFEGDAVSRLANAFYVLHSRDQHFAAIGFVWNPLSSLLDLPFLLFNSYWNALSSHIVAGTTVSALSMAGASYQVNAILREWKVRVPPRLILTAFFAADPMILLYGGNGMSEAIYLFTMLAAARYLMRWIRDDDLPSLVYSASALGIAYLERSEPVAAAAFASFLIFGVTFFRNRDALGGRLRLALTDAVIYLMPVLTAFVGWAVVSYVITGQAFAQFTSKYGNSALISEAHAPKMKLVARLIHEGQAIEFLAPLFPLIVAMALVVAIRRRDVQLLGMVAILGGGLAFTLLSYLDNSIFPWFRYYIMVIPIDVLLVGSLLARVSGVHAGSQGLVHTSAVPDKTDKSSSGWLAGFASALLVVTLLGASIPSTARGLMNPNIDGETLLIIGPIFHVHPNSTDRNSKKAYYDNVAFAQYFEHLHLPVGDVIADSGDSCIPNMIVVSTDPRTFVITNDRDFQRTLADPLAFHAHYLLEGVHSSQNDAVVDQYPSLGKSTPWARLVHTFPARGDCVQFNLYRVVGFPTEG
jgi:hypothetical protein